MMVVTDLNSTRPLFRVNEGALQFGSVTTKYPMCDNDWPTEVLERSQNSFCVCDTHKSC
jgi:hypothetical protein